MLKCGGLASTVKLERSTGSEDGQPWLCCIVHTRPAELSRGSGCRQMTSCLSRWSGVAQIISSNDVKKNFFSLYNLVAIFRQNQSCKWPDFCPA